MRRRTLLGAGGATLAGLARPALAQAPRLLRFVPQSDVAALDPAWTTAYVTRNHALLVFDTLYGLDAAYRPHPQMVEGHAVEADGLLWRLTLREGLRFHDGAPVLARDCVASIRRWGARDGFGQTLMAATEELSAPSDREIRFRLKRPFPLLPAALGKAGSSICAIMPERLAATDPFTQVSEMVGSGPFRFNAAARVPGALLVYERNAAYVPRAGGEASFTAGPKTVHLDRVEWHVLPDPATAAAALRAGEMDWWENPPADLMPMLRRAPNLAIRHLDPTGYVGCMRFNHLQPPFDNPGLRRAVLRAVEQADFMTAAIGTDRALWSDGAGIFPRGTPMASEAGMEALTAPRDLERSRREVAASGYRGERVVLFQPTDFPVLKGLAEVGADLLRRLGLNLDVQAMDWGSAVQRLPRREGVEAGGWSVFHTVWAGMDQLNPAVHAYLRGRGTNSPTGWPTSPALEAMREEWLAAPDEAAQRAIAARMQETAFGEVPYIPLGRFLAPTAARRDLDGMLTGLPLFWNIRRG